MASAAANGLPRSRRSEQVQLREGVDIALTYFNTGDRTEIESLTKKAKNWADRYFKSYQYACKRPTTLLELFPNLFNMNVEAHCRLLPKITVEPTDPEPHSGDSRQFRRWERRNIHTEPFPEFAEPTLASEALIEQVMEMSSRHKTDSHSDMNIDAATFRESGLLNFLPEFLGQLASVNLDAETELACNSRPISPAISEDEGATQEQTTMDAMNELRETQQRRHGRRVNVPGGRPFKLPGEEAEGNACDNASETRPDHAEFSIPVDNSQDCLDSGDETDASTSTTASLIANRKRKLNPISDEASPANKLRVLCTKPVSTLSKLSRQYKAMLAEYARQYPNSSAKDALGDLEHKMPAPEQSTTIEKTDERNGKERNSPALVPINKVRLKIPEGWSTPKGSLTGSPVVPSPAKVITLEVPRSRTPSPAASLRPSLPASGKIKLKDPRSRKASPEDVLRRSASPCKVTKSQATDSRRTSPTSSDRRSATPKRLPKIKWINKKPTPDRSPSPQSPIASSPSGSISSSNLEITRPTSACSNTSSDSNWSTGSRDPRIKWVNKKSTPAAEERASSPILRPTSSCSDGSGKKHTFKIAKRPRVKSVELDERRSSKKQLLAHRVDGTLSEIAR